MDYLGYTKCFHAACASQVSLSLTRRHSLGNCELHVLWSPSGVTAADVTRTAGMSTSASFRLSATVWAGIIDIPKSGISLF